MTQRWASRRGLRERIWITVVAGIAVVLLALTAGFNLLIANRLTHEADSVVVARATAELDALKVNRTGIDLTETFDAGAPDTPTWVFQGARPLEEPHANAAERAAALRLTARGPGFSGAPGTSIRVYGLPVMRGSRRVGTVVAAVDLAPYEQIERTGLVASSVLALLALVAVAGASRWILSRALRPVATMTRKAAEWSEHDLERRFALGEPQDEFTTLAATLDGLLDRVAASLRHEQNLTAELSHELRTPLTQISAEAQFALRHGEASEELKDSYRRIVKSARQMTRILDTLIAAARAQADASRIACDASAAARMTVDAFQFVAAEAGIETEVIAPPQPIMIGVEAGFVERVLAPLLENACRFARQHVSVEIADAGRYVELIIQDDGPGIRPEDLEDVFRPGARTEPAATALLTSAGLGLPLARRLARGVGGDVRVGDCPSGARIIVSLPRG
jgi:two-component system, OmpR family, sensor kinase